jgi:hypothetical protein
VSGGTAQLFLNLSTRRGGGQLHAPAAFTPGKDPVRIVQEAGWALEPVWVGTENLYPPGFDPRTFQPVAIRYTDYAIPAPSRRIVERYLDLRRGEGPWSTEWQRTYG